MAFDPTPNYNAVMQLARDIPGEFEHKFLEPCHVTLAILRHGAIAGNTGTKVVDAITYGQTHQVKTDLESGIESYRQNPQHSGIINSALQRPTEYARALNSDFTGTEHLLYGMVEHAVRTTRSPQLIILQKAGPGIDLKNLDRWTSIVMAKEGKPVGGLVDRTAEAAARNAI